MRKFILALFFVSLCLIPLQVSAADIDGSAPLLCSVTKAFECSEDEGCTPASAMDLNLPRFFRIDAPQKKVTAVKEGGRTTVIQNISEVDGKLILQGAEKAVENVRGGIGWTAIIMQESGNLILSISGDDAGFIVFGACLKQ